MTDAGWLGLAWPKSRRQLRRWDHHASSNQRWLVTCLVLTITLPHACLFVHGSGYKSLADDMPDSFSSDIRFLGWAREMFPLADSSRWVTLQTPLRGIDYTDPGTETRAWLCTKENVMRMVEAASLDLEGYR